MLALLYLTGLLWRHSRRSPRFAVRLFPLVAAVTVFGMPLMLGMWGSENMVAVSCMVTAALLLLRSERPVAAGLFAFLGIMMRMDAGLGALMIGLVALVRRRRIPWAYGLAGVLPLALWLPFLHAHFGQVIPSTLEAKRSIVTPDFPSYGMQQWYYLCWALSESGRWNLLALLVLASRGATSVGALLARLAPGGRPRRLATVLGTLLAIGLCWNAMGEHLWAKRHQALDERFRIYRDLGRYLETNTAPDSVVAAQEIGITGYFAERPMLDLCGLISPDVVHARQENRLNAYVRESAPDYLVDNPYFYASRLYRAVVARVGNAEHYAVVREFSTPEYPAESIRLLKRID